MGRKKKNTEIHQEQLFNELLEMDNIYTSTVEKYAGPSRTKDDWDYDSDSYGNQEW